MSLRTRHNHTSITWQNIRLLSKIDPQFDVQKLILNVFPWPESKPTPCVLSVPIQNNVITIHLWSPHIIGNWCVAVCATIRAVFCLNLCRQAKSVRGKLYSYDGHGTDFCPGICEMHHLLATCLSLCGWLFSRCFFLQLCDGFRCWCGWVFSNSLATFQETQNSFGQILTVASHSIPQISGVRHLHICCGF